MENRESMLGVVRGYGKAVVSEQNGRRICSGEFVTRAEHIGEFTNPEGQVTFSGPVYIDGEY